MSAYKTEIKDGKVVRTKIQPAGYVCKVCGGVFHRFGCPVYDVADARIWVSKDEYERLQRATEGE